MQLASAYKQFTNVIPLPPTSGQLFSLFIVASHTHQTRPHEQLVGGWETEEHLEESWMLDVEYFRSFNRGELDIVKIET